MKTKIVLGLAALALSLVAVKSFTPVSAYQGDITQRGPNCTDERHAQMTDLLKKGDYNGWVKLMEGKGITRRVNQENFKEFASARLSEDQTKFDEFRSKYGMGQGNGMGRNRQ